ncbi:XRE family transcriptional regulator [Chromobacterium haemolyticum]|uniref:XRE family transcriptional regulator n=1 Tax=Chromobacterium fluminis TaxID=3044269 RepID=A0ABX0L667_9NEIS|nr:XRE family transcriptional regulator [Chromobacterium haemolyticum]NHR06496.1 XRE family transcriptional regulator [Chromobacterium haemolyticum]
MTNWIETLRAAVLAQGQQAVARRLNYSRTTISLVLAGKYGGRVDLVQNAVQTELGTVACPFSGQTIARDVCATISTEPIPTHNPSKLANWQHCRHCPNRSTGE